MHKSEEGFLSNLALLITSCYIKEHLAKFDFVRIPIVYFHERKWGLCCNERIHRKVTRGHVPEMRYQKVTIRVFLFRNESKLPHHLFLQ